MTAAPLLGVMRGIISSRPRPIPRISAGRWASHVVRASFQRILGILHALISQSDQRPPRDLRDLPCYHLKQALIRGRSSLGYCALFLAVLAALSSYMVHSWHGTMLSRLQVAANEVTPELQVYVSVARNEFESALNRLAVLVVMSLAIFLVAIESLTTSLQALYAGLLHRRCNRVNAASTSGLLASALHESAVSVDKLVNRRVRRGGFLVIVGIIVVGVAVNLMDLKVSTPSVIVLCAIALASMSAMLLGVPQSKPPSSEPQAATTLFICQTTALSSLALSLVMLLLFPLLSGIWAAQFRSTLVRASETIENLGVRLHGHSEAQSELRALAERLQEYGLDVREKAGRIAAWIGERAFWITSFGGGFCVWILLIVLQSKVPSATTREWRMQLFGNVATGVLFEFVMRIGLPWLGAPIGSWALGAIVVGVGGFCVLRILTYVAQDPVRLANPTPVPKL